MLNLNQKAVNEMKLSFPSYSENERFSRIAVSGFLTQLDPQIDELSEIKTAVSEGVTNCIVHAYRDAVGEIFLQVRIFDKGRVYIKIRDKGCGIDDIQKAMEPLFTTAPEEERAGLGFAVMESFMDKIKVRSQKGKGTTVVMEKTLKTRKAFR
ncbi:anti-sigma F factor [Ruminococcus sp. Marseille-P6503]|uniref:anti-sigma F factor n=1 Tax=Ruminococcus sp. Marseille-P6503 TaxID=2364796 RepID=UPI001FAA91A4|nr:anti-sigma F factor [Ruminococcus sp. Marseille-P6503]